MILLHFLPDSFLAMVVHIILVLGIGGTVLDMFIRYIPGIIQYRIPLKVLSTLLLIAGIYLEGSYSTEMIWRARVKEVEAKVALAEAQSKEANVIIQEKVVEKIKVVKEKVIVNQIKIQKEKEVINAECKVPVIAIESYNNAVKGGSNE
jgi:hypothetical protein